MRHWDNSLSAKTASYSGRSLSPAERNYSVGEVECLGLVSAITEHSHFLTAMPFTVLTDHQSLQYLKTVKNTGNRRIFRWMLQLQSYDFTVKYLPGKLNDAADCLSRREYPEQGPEDPDDDIRNDDIYFSMISKPHRQINCRRERDESGRRVTGVTSDVSRHECNDNNQDLTKVVGQINQEVNHNKHYISYLYRYINAYTGGRNTQHTNHDNNHDSDHVTDNKMHNVTSVTSHSINHNINHDCEYSS